LAAYEIPLSSTDQVFQIPLGGVTYTLTSKWCAPANAWTLDIADANGVALVSGIPLVTGVDLLEQYQYLGIAGQLVAQTDGDTFAVPTQANLGTGGRLYFVIADGAASTPAPEVITYTPMFTRGVQNFDPDLQSISDLTTVGIAVRGANSAWTTTDAVMGISVRDYGAVGDGTTHDAAAFQAALNAAASSTTTKTVLVPHRPNGYILEATVSVPAGVTLLGENRKGGETSRIKPASGFSDPLIQTQGYGTGRILRPQVVGLFLDGSGTTLTAMQLMMQEGIVRDCTIKNCWTYGIHMSGYGSGISQQALNNLLENNYVAGEGGTTFYDGIFIDYHCADTTFRGNYVETATNSCIRSRGFNDMVVGNHLYNAPNLYKSETSCDKLIIGNYLENSTGSAIDIAGGSSSDSTLSAAIGGNTFRNINKGGSSSGIITVSGSNIDALTVINNTLRRDGATSYTAPYLVYFNGISPATRRVVGNIWQSGVITTAESNLPADFQPWDAELTALAAVTSAADMVPYFTGSGTAATTSFTASGRALTGLTGAADKVPYWTAAGTASTADFTAAGRSVVGAANDAAQRTALGLAIGTNVQAHSSELDAVAAIATTGFVQRTAANTWSATTPPGALLGILQDQKAQNTAGGTFTHGGWRTRDLNTEVHDRNSILSISGNEFTISAAGSYEIEWRASAYCCGTHQSRLYNVTDASVVSVGDTAASYITGYTTTPSSGIAQLTIASAKTFRIEHACSATSTTYGFGYPGNLSTEIYTSVTVRQG
jgi:hypothetical protein